VVDDKKLAHARVVQLGMRTPEGGVELTRGVNAGELMVVRGIEPLSDGAPVKISAKKTLEEALKPPPPGQEPPPTTEDSGGGGGSGSGAGSGRHRRGSAQ